MLKFQHKLCNLLVFFLFSHFSSSRVQPRHSGKDPTTSPWRFWGRLLKDRDARKETWPHSAEETCWKHRMEVEFTSTKVPNISLSFSPAPSARLGKPGGSRTYKHTFCQKPCAPSILATFVSRNERMRTAWQKYKQDFQKSVFSEQTAQLKSGLYIIFILAQIYSKLEALSQTEVQASLLLSS